ncbi:hypothetical protein F4802DRAFT_386861 [Xylaria palmicola]|nr:hypothetical protein F4802DRAFT_386861 [Xylaria palmicola]
MNPATIGVLWAGDSALLVWQVAARQCPSRSQRRRRCPLSLLRTTKIRYLGSSQSGLGPKAWARAWVWVWGPDVGI